MAEKNIFFGQGGPAGNTVSWRGILDDDTLAAGRATDFHVEVTRETGAAIAPPGVTVVVFKLPLGLPVSIDRPGPDVGTGSANQLDPGETQAIDFHITNDASGGPGAAAYVLVIFMFWAGSGLIGPAVFTVGAPF